MVEGFIKKLNTRNKAKINLLSLMQKNRYKVYKGKASSHSLYNEANNELKRQMIKINQERLAREFIRDC